ncbi:hotdog fold thioesterase [Amycolatopsis acidiphila]|uniref:Hotdog fold thioesterase n=1 Tax=Amycolatopsis acidiphila TaxID=715473 RepID=A0A558AKS6_9PSEU|nr:hotdog fold thioesterase [Amycolatopsis acidiphila]TVT24811.1 hotdog fold thioesterase [Amycolatopsis acidiphila]UIJ62792.1 hotdog fold thioesterase [Amycolatopsis acidiphila]GHG64218.1 aromatic compound degradation protein PaaI [Amycolatopsis acidiphila]
MTEHLSEDFHEQFAGIDPAAAGQQLNDKIGLSLLEVGAQRVVGTMPVDGNRQPYGLLHGGANAVLAEALGSTVAALNAGPDKMTVGFELSCTHHRGVRAGVVTGTAVPLHVGRSTITTEIVLTDESGRRTCTARLTCIVRDRPGA